MLSQSCAAVQPAYRFHSISHANFTRHDLQQLQAFYALTPGTENLLPRARCMAALVATARASVIVARHNGAVIGSIASLPNGDVDEISAVLIAPNHRKLGLDAILRERHAASGNGRPQVMFERFAKDKREDMIALREAEGWTLLPESDPLYRRIEKSKPKSLNPNAKTGFIRAVNGTLLAIHNLDVTGRRHLRSLAHAHAG